MRRVLHTYKRGELLTGRVIEESSDGMSSKMFAEVEVNAKDDNYTKRKPVPDNDEDAAVMYLEDMMDAEYKKLCSRKK